MQRRGVVAYHACSHLHPRTVAVSGSEAVGRQSSAVMLDLMLPLACTRFLLSCVIRSE